MTTTNLPSWCYTIDEILEEVAERRGMTPEEVRTAITQNEGGKES